MKKLRDILTVDMFLDVPKAVIPSAGSLSCRGQIAGIMSDVLTACSAQGDDRYMIAATMSRLLGREISKHILDAYTAESREDHIPPFDTAIAFDMATGGISLLKFYSELLGCRVTVGKEVLLTELGRLTQMKKELAEQEKQIKNRLEASK